jgi:hypothetical protein
MNFEPTEDLATFLTFVDRIAARYRVSWVPADARYQFSTELEHELETSGFFASANEEGLGLVAAASMVCELSKLSVCAEVAASSLIGPLVCPEAARPLAVIWGDAKRPARFLPVARTVLRVDGPQVWIAELHDGDVVKRESLFAYPMGTLKDPATLRWTLVQNSNVGRIQDLWRIGLSAELVGCLQSGLDSVVAHVTERRQFGRPLGSFQAIQHRLAACACSIQSARWLMLKAACSGSALDAVTAAAFVQDIATKVVYDLHQFMGAMGLTLEHPLHRWTYRAKLLRSDLGGAEQNFQEVADLAWKSN